MALYVNGKKVAGIGLPGKSAYQYAVDGGYTGTEEEFHAELAEVKNKQNKLSGTKGQVVGFDADGNAQAQDAPASGITQEEADARYLIRKDDGTVSGWRNQTFMALLFLVLRPLSTEMC